jgi:hypothetical protein
MSSQPDQDEVARSLGWIKFEQIPQHFDGHCYRLVPKNVAIGNRHERRMQWKLWMKTWGRRDA